MSRSLAFASLAWLTTVDLGSVHGFLTNDAHPMQQPSSLLQAAQQSDESTQVSRRNVLTTVASGAVVASTVLTQSVTPASARLEGVNKPELLPKEPGANVIQTEKFLTAGQAKRMDQLLTNLERDTGYRVRVLCQAYPNTPGLAIRDYWDLGKEGQKDDKYIVLVVDQFGGKGNVLNFNVGEGIKFALPNGKSQYYTTIKSRCDISFLDIDLCYIHSPLL